MAITNASKLADFASGASATNTSVIQVDYTNQRVGIGTTSPAGRLTIVEATAGTAIDLMSSNGNGAGTIGTTDEATTLNGIAIKATRGGGKIVFNTASSERARIDSSGRLLVGTATANTSGGVLQLSSGITFPATAVASADPNTLDDYEEGTWTPVDQSGAGLSLTASLPSYTKVGRLVTASAYVVFPTTTNTSQVTISLPFQCGNVVGAGMVRYTTSSVIHTIHVNPAASTFSLYAAGGSSVNNISYSGLRLDFEVVYFASS
jgi:hypothetical protein